MGIGAWIHTNILMVIVARVVAAVAAIAVGWTTGGAFFAMLMGIFLMMKAETDRHQAASRGSRVQGVGLGAALWQALEDLEAVPRLACDGSLDLGGNVLEQRAQALARRGLVVGDEDADHARAAR